MTSFGPRGLCSMACFFGLWVLLGVCAATTCHAQAEMTSPDGTGRASSNGLPADELNVGIMGRYRLGHWTRIELPPSVAVEPDTAWTIQTIDGDGVDVQYTQSNESPANSRVGFAIPSTEAALIQVQVSDQTVLSKRFPELGSPSKEPSMVPIEMPWVVVIGDAIGVDQIGANDLLGRDATIAISNIVNANSLPSDSLGYSGVTMVMVNATGLDVLKQMTQAQQDAVVRWVQADGGKLFVCLGESSREVLSAAPWLGEVMPLSASPVLDEQDPSAFETYTSSQTQLESFSGLRLSRDLGIPLVTGRTKRRIVSRFVVRYLSGYGEVIAVAADLDRRPFVDWPDRMTLLNRIHGDTLVVANDAKKVGKRNTAFDDLAGQTRATLDQFATKRPFQFSVLSLVMMGLILLIGPLDYLLINRLVGRPLLGWLTLPLIVIAFSVLLVRHSSRSAASNLTDLKSVDSQSVSSGESLPGDVDVNHLEITDVDTIDGVGRSIAWDVVYSHDGGRFDVKAVPASDWVGDRVRSVLTRPFGYASQTFGGIQIEADSGLPAYTAKLVSDDGVLRSQLAGVPLAPRSSKSIATSLQFDFPMDQPVEIVRRRGGDALQTGLRNPLPVDVLDGMVVYRNWVYYLPTRLRSGETIESLEQLRQRNFRWHLTRQKATESSSDAQQWNAEDFGDPMRLAEMLMFHDVVGGERYTGLKHQALGGLDMSDLLADDRCVMIGRLAAPLADVSFVPAQTTGGDEAVEDSSVTSGGDKQSGHRVSLVRVVLPVVTQAR